MECPEQRGLCGLPFQIGLSTRDQNPELQLQQQSIEKLRLQRQKVQIFKHQFQLKVEQLEDKNNIIARLNSRVECLDEFRLKLQELQPQYQRLLFQYKRVCAKQTLFEEQLSQIASKGWPDQVLKLQELNSKCQNENGLLRIKLQKQEQDLQRMKQMMEERETGFANTQQSIKIKIQSFKNQLSRLLSQNSKLEDRNGSIESELEHTQRIASQLKARQGQLKEYIENLRTSLCGKQTQILKLREELDFQKLHCHREVSELTVLVDRLQLQLKRSVMQENSAKLCREELELNNKQLAGTNQRLTQQNNRLSAQLKY